MSLEPLLTAPWHIQVHAFSAMAAVVLGGVQFAAPKGTIPHRTLGYIWVIFMAVAALTAVFIREINDGGFSWIHILIPITLLGVAGLVAHARRGLSDKHRRSALVLFLAALLIPGVFSFMPGRIMFEVIAL